MSQVQNTPKTKPVSNKAFRIALQKSGVPQEQIDVLVAQGIKNGAVSKSSSGKLNVLRDAFPTFEEIENKLNTWFLSNKDKIDEVLTSNGFDKAKKISVNVNK
jgi:hypothetical protein